MRRTDDTDGGRGKADRKKPPVGKGYDAEFKGYINLQLTEKDKEQFGVWVLTSDAPEMFDAAVTDGVNISIKVDPKSQGFLASGTQRRVDSPNAGLVVTARAKEPQLALWRLVYIFSLLYATGHWEDRQPMTDPDRW